MQCGKICGLSKQSINQDTLLVQIFRWQKNQPLLIQRSRPSRDSYEPKTTKNFQFSLWLFQKIPFLYFFLHKSWIWRTLGYVMNIFFIGIFIMLQKNTFGQKNFKFHAPVQKRHFGRIKKLPKWHFRTGACNFKNFLTKSILLKHYENANKKKYS